MLAGAVQLQRFSDCSPPFASISKATADRLVTGDGPLISGGDGELQNFGEGRRAGPMHRRAHGHLAGFQIEQTALAAALEDET